MGSPAGEPPVALRVEQARLHSLFPTFVWQTRLTAQAAREMNAEMLTAIDAKRAGQPPLAPRQMFQSDQDLHLSAAFAGFVRLLRGAVEGVLEFLQVESRELLITGCWANVAAPGAIHHPHSHPNNFLSGVYYVRAAAGANRITFEDPRPQTLVVSPRMRQATIENSTFMNVTIDEGTLLVFPAWLQHKVPPNRSGAERISVSFNVMFARYAESLAGREGTGLTRLPG